MTRRQKIGVGIGTATFLCAVTLTVYELGKLGDGLCGNSIVQNVVSPDGQIKAVIFERDCGAATGFSTQVSVIRAGSALPNSPGNIFVADGSSAPAGPSGTMPLRVSWVGSHHLEMQYPPDATLHQRSGLINISASWFRRVPVHIHYTTLPKPE